MISASKRLAHSALLVSLALGLTACGNKDMQDLHAYVDKVQSRQKPRVEPLPEVQPYETFLYQASGMRDPFKAQTSQLSDAGAAASGSGLKPDVNRPREALEDFPLDTLRMVGTLAQQGDTWALVVDADGTIHRVQPGNYAGQNYGKITTITEYEVQLTEIVPDGLGGWMERPATLALSE